MTYIKTSEGWVCKYRNGKYRWSHRPVFNKQHPRKGEYLTNVEKALAMLKGEIT